MANQTKSMNEQCFPFAPMMPFLLVLSITATPFHILIMKVLIQRFRLSMPRHTILLWLSISDNFQILSATLHFAAGQAINPSIISLTCQVLRHMVEVLGVMGHCASSGCIIALSVERYIACVYSLRLHALVTSERVTRALISIVVISIVLGLLVIHPQTPNYSTEVISNGKRILLVFIITVYLSSVILTIIQFHLYRISRSKLRVTPHHITHGAQKEGQDLTRRQINLGIAASVVVVMYIACMFPIACLFAYTLVHHGKEVGGIRAYLLALAILNTFADPFVYGFGMADVRKGIKKEFSKLKKCVISHEETS